MSQRAYFKKLALTRIAYMPARIHALHSKELVLIRNYIPALRSLLRCQMSTLQADSTQGLVIIQLSTLCHVLFAKVK